MWKRMLIVFGVLIVLPLISAQVGPTVFTPRLTVSPGPLTVSTGLTTVQNLTINGTCTGCPTSPPGGANTQVQFNNAGAFGGDAGFTYTAASDTASIGVVHAGAGDATAPALSFSGDTDTGLFSSTNILGVTTGGTARYIIGAAGELGIGATPTNGTSGQVFTSGGTGSPPTWTTPLTETSGSFTATFDDGCTTSPTVAFLYRKIGTVVTLRWDNMSPTTCTSDSITFDTNSLGEVPADIRPSSTQSSGYIPVIDNSLSRKGQVSISTTGNVQMRLCALENAAASGLQCSTNLWTNANLKSIQAGQFSYSTAW